MNRSNRIGKHLRLTNYDYSQAGAYFVTFCVKDRLPLLSQVCPSDNAIDPPVVRLSSFGSLTEEAILQIPERYSGTQVDAYVIMPNHVHLLVCLPSESGPKLGRIIQHLKGFVTKQCGQAIWQDKYYDHAVRNEADYRTKYQYILDNPAKWAEDEYYSLLK